MATGYVPLDGAARRARRGAPSRGVWAARAHALMDVLASASVYDGGGDNSADDGGQRCSACGAQVGIPNLRAAQVFLGAARALGFPARYVSGYISYRSDGGEAASARVG